jgi:hypothetical protein
MKTLLGSGGTPWHALKDLSLRMHAMRGDADSCMAAAGDIVVRIVHVKTAFNTEAQWVAEASWRMTA